MLLQNTEMYQEFFLVQMITFFNLNSYNFVLCVSHSIITALHLYMPFITHYEIFISVKRR